jgi:hypothetical protein
MARVVSLGRAIIFTVVIVAPARVREQLSFAPITNRNFNVGSLRTARPRRAPPDRDERCD